jgi:hypothetical protein
LGAGGGSLSAAAEGGCNEARCSRTPGGTAKLLEPVTRVTGMALYGWIPILGTSAVSAQHGEVMGFAVPENNDRTNVLGCQGGKKD